MDGLMKLLGEFPVKVDLEPAIVEQEDCGSYIREKVEYYVEKAERVSAYACTPKNATKSTPIVFCHHQHAGNFTLGKSEVVGLGGDPDQAYAHELAEKGFITFAPDAIAFEERDWSGEGKSEYFELATRLVQGKTLMAKVIHDISAGLDYIQSRDKISDNKIGFIGHSYGGRMALWMPAFDKRIKASVSNCGCIPYSQSLTHDTGIQMEFCVPGIMDKFDLSGIIKQYKDCALLISATTDDKWSRGAKVIYDEIKPVLREAVELKLYDDGHVFSKLMRNNAYEFLEKHLK